MATKPKTKTQRTPTKVAIGVVGRRDMYGNVVKREVVPTGGPRKIGKSPLLAVGYGKKGKIVSPREIEAAIAKAVGAGHVAKKTGRKLSAPQQLALLAQSMVLSVREAARAVSELSVVVLRHGAGGPLVDHESSIAIRNAVAHDLERAAHRIREGSLDTWTAHEMRVAVR